MNFHSKPNHYRKQLESIRDRLDAVGVQTFNFAFYPEGTKMLEYNTEQNSKAHATRFTSHGVWEKGSSEEILAEFLGLVHPEDINKLVDYVQAHLETSMSGRVGLTPTAFSSERFRAKETGQDYRWYELRSHLVLDPKLKIVICEGCFLDITDLVEREQELANEIAERSQAQKALEETLNTLKKTQNELINSSKLKALGEMTSSVAHDFGNLINPLLFYGQSLQTQLQELQELTNQLSFLESDQSDQSLVKKDLSQVKSQFTKLIGFGQENLQKMDLAILDSLSLIKRLRATYHPKQDSCKSHENSFTAKPVLVSASELVQSAWYLARSKWRGALELLPRFGVSGDDFSIYLDDESELRQALINLICNSLDAIYEKFQAHLDQADLDVSVELSIHSSAYKISILDQGIGMDAHSLHLAQQSFYSSKGEYGSGLGLLSVQQTMQKLNGWIELVSEPNQWTKVTLNLPK